MYISEVTGFSYKESNIIVYFIIVPLVFLHLFDRLLKRNILKICFAILTLTILFSIGDFYAFSIKLFGISQDFLNWFSIIGWNYIEASVIICVILPFLLFSYLIYQIHKVKIKKFFTS